MQVTGREELLSNNPVVKRLYDVRRPMTDPMNVLQVCAIHDGDRDGFRP